MRWISWVPQISSKESQYQERPFYFKFPREYSPVQVERKIQRVRNYTQSKRPWDTPCGRSRWFYFKKVQTVASKGIQRLWKESWLRLQQSSISGELHKITWRRFDGTKLWRTSLRLKPLQRSIQVSSKWNDWTARLFDDSSKDSCGITNLILYNQIVEYVQQR